MLNSTKISPKQSETRNAYITEMPKKISFDEFLVQQLGSIGRYQFLQFLLVCIPSAFVAMHVMSWTFVALQSDEICINTTTGIDCEAAKYSATERWDLRGNRAWIKATVQSFYYVGHMIGALLWGITSDKIGRKKAFCIAIATQIICGVLLIVAPTWWLFATLKFGTGVAHPGIYAVGIVLGTELLGAKWRRLAAVGAGFTSGIGELVLVLVAYLVYDYRIIHVIIVAPSLVFFTYWWLVPESLRWLVAKGRSKEADRILHKAARMNNSQIPDQWWNQIEVCKHSQQASYGLLDLVRTPKLRRRTLVNFFIWPVNSMMYYGLTMKSNLGGGNFHVNFAISAAVEIPGLIALYLLVDRLGRRRLTTFSLLVVALCLVLNWIIGDNVPLVCAMLQMAVAKGAITTAFTGLYTYTSEMFPTVIRNTAVGCCSTTSRLGAIVASYLALWLVDEHGKLAMVIPFCLLALAAAILTALFLPETMNKPLPETIADVETSKANN